MVTYSRPDDSLGGRRKTNIKAWEGKKGGKKGERSGGSS